MMNDDIITLHDERYVVTILNLIRISTIWVFILLFTDCISRCFNAIVLFVLHQNVRFRETVVSSAVSCEHTI